MWLLHSFLRSVNQWASHIGIHKGFHSLCVVQKWLCLLCFAKHVVKCETIITLLLSFGGLQWNSVAGFQELLRKKRPFCSDFYDCEGDEYALKTSEVSFGNSHSFLLISVWLFQIWRVHLMYHTSDNKKFRIIYGFSDSFNSCIILLLSRLESN